MSDPSASVEAQQVSKPRKRWMIRITTPEGIDIFLRRGHTLVADPIVQFRAKQDAEISMEMVKLGLDKTYIGNVVPYDADDE